MIRLLDRAKSTVRVDTARLSGDLQQADADNSSLWSILQEILPAEARCLVRRRFG